MRDFLKQLPTFPGILSSLTSVLAFVFQINFSINYLYSVSLMYEHFYVNGYAGAWSWHLLDGTSLGHLENE